MDDADFRTKMGIAGLEHGTLHTPLNKLVVVPPPSSKINYAKLDPRMISDCKLIDDLIVNYSKVANNQMNTTIHFTDYGRRLGRIINNYFNVMTNFSKFDVKNFYKGFYQLSKLIRILFYPDELRSNPDNFVLFEGISGGNIIGTS